MQFEVLENAKHWVFQKSGKGEGTEPCKNIMKQMFASFLYLCFLVSPSKIQHVEPSNTIHFFQHFQASNTTFRRLIFVQESHYETVSNKQQNTLALSGLLHKLHRS